MKAIIYTKYGSPDVLELQEIEKPIPEDNEVLIKIHATTVTKYDCWMRRGTGPPGFKLLSRMATGFRKPKNLILGLELAGEIVEVGENIKKFKKGDQVFGFSAEKMSTYAEYICLQENDIALKAKNMTYEEAAAVPYGALTSLYFLRKANIKNGQKVLVYGASGGVGLYAVQLAKYFGAEVTGVCSTLKINLVKSAGADNIIDYTKKNNTKSDEKYDIIFDSIGKIPLSSNKKSLKKGGSFISVTFGLFRILRLLWLQMINKWKLVIGSVDLKNESMMFLTELIESSKLQAFIDKKFSLRQISEAHEYLESGKKKGQIVISII